MRKHLLLFLFSLISSTIFAQFDYSVSQPYKVVDGEKFYIGEEGKMLAVKRHRKEIYIQKFNAKAPALLRTKKYSDTELPRGFVIEKLIKFHNQYFLFFNVWDKKNNTEQLFYREIDFELGEFVGRNQLLFKIDGKITGTPLFRFSNSSSFYAGGGSAIPGIVINLNGSKKIGFSFSQDSSKLIVQYKKHPKVRSNNKNKDIIGMYVYSSGLEKIAGRELEMPYTEKKMDVLDYTVDKSGTPYLIAKVFSGNNRKEKTKNTKGKGKVANYRIELIKVNIESGRYKISPIQIENKFIVKLALHESTDNTMICTGYYNTRGRTSKRGKWTISGGVTNPPIDGVCAFKIDKDGGVSDIIYHEIPVEVMNMYEKKGKQKRNQRKDERGKAQLKNLTFKESVVQDDGSYLLIGEQYYVIQTQSSTPSMYGTSTTRSNPKHYYEDILVTKINADGSLAWMQKLPKRQMSARSPKGGLSFKYINDKATGNHYLMYLDNVKNIDLDINKTPKKHIDGKGGFLTSYKINDETGKVSKENLFDLRDVKGFKAYQFYTDRVVHTSGNRFLIEVYKKQKEDILIKIEVK